MTVVVDGKKIACTVSDETFGSVASHDSISADVTTGGAASLLVMEGATVSGPTPYSAVVLVQYVEAANWPKNSSIRG